MDKDDLLDKNEIKDHVPKWVLSTGYTLLFLSVFINSIGLNLMQINGALTENVVSRIEAGSLKDDGGSFLDKGNVTSEDLQEIKASLKDAATKEDIKIILERLEVLERVSHAPAPIKG